MLQVPEGLTRLDLAFGKIDHMPKYSTLPEEFQRERHQACRDVQTWFFAGAEGHDNGIKIKDSIYTARDGVNAPMALAAIKCVLGSFEPKHEHKIAACGYMLDQWFERQPAKAQ